MLTRSISGALFVLVLVACVVLGKYSSLLLFTFAGVLGVLEFYKLSTNISGVSPLKVTGAIIGVTCSLLVMFAVMGFVSTTAVFVCLPLLFSIFVIELYRKQPFPFHNITYTILGILYVILPFTLLFHLGFYNNYHFSMDYNYQLIMGYFLLLWSSDTGAYLAGKFFGKHKLMERISPKKTWEGSVGGGILSIFVAVIIAHYFTTIQLQDWIIISVIVVVLGGIGDLVESMFKRSINVKDSGNILPGHGGILDRFDGLFISVPFVYAYLQLLAS